MKLQKRMKRNRCGNQREELHAVFPHRVQNHAANKIDQHLGKALQFARHQPAGRPRHDHEDGDERHHHPHHDDGFVDGNIQAAKIDRNIVVQFKRMQRTFFHAPFRDASIDYCGHRCAIR